MKLSKFAFITILIIGFFLRVISFGKIPVALNRDEAALGYNAYTIAQFGVDEWGKHFPISFKSFGDFKLPGYIYADAVFISVFGVHDWSIRLPSLLAGMGIIVVTYLITMQWFGRKNSALLAMLLMAISPWSVFYSRMAFEANLGLFLMLVAIYGFELKNKVGLLIGFISYACALFTYNAPLLLIPVAVIYFLVTPQLPKIHRVLIVAILMFVGLVGIFALSEITTQKQGISIFSDPTLINYEASHYSAARGLVEQLYWNKWVFFGREMLSRWMLSWTPAFLVIEGGQNPWHSVPQGAHFYWVIYGGIIFGLFKLIKSKNVLNIQKVALGVLVGGSLLPAIITVDAPHATRSLFFFWLLTVFAGYGLTTFLKKSIKVIVILLVIELLFFCYKYFILFPQFRSSAWPVGLESTLLATESQFKAGQEIIIQGADADLLSDQIYIYPLLYWRVSPIWYQTVMKSQLPNAAHMNQITGFANLSIFKYNQTSNGIIIERLSDGSFKRTQ